MNQYRYRYRKTFFQRAIGFSPIAIGVVFAVASVAKAYSVATSETVWDLSLNGKYIRTAFLAFSELCYGVLLITGLYRKSAQTICFLTLIAFCGFHFFNIILDRGDCSCFGALKTSPKTMLFINLLLLSILVAHWIVGEESGSWRINVGFGVFVVSSLLHTHAISLWTPSTRLQSEHTAEMRDRDTNFIFRDSLNGKQLSSLVDCETQLCLDTKYLMVVSADCGSCKRFLSDLAERIPTFEIQKCWILVERTGSSRNTSVSLSFRTERISYRNATTRQRIVGLPLVGIVRDGIVENVLSEDEFWKLQESKR